ncbi:TetR/AcrR family transcriptional regulator [Clostridium sp. E02]|uniref:TetR/AcrR family transcriptional regulator n=1 Tax=Clostridium sp. E02 TaxID=2487134 RepID=UPI000F536DB0|nr:TetR/AcrR family transcriptional regulator [Clostridium sp. E02]
MRKKDDEKVRSIKEAVIKLILQEGFHGTSVSKIAKMAGVSPATVYIYFENKEDMLHDIYLEYSEEIFDYLLQSIEKETDGARTIEILIRSYYNYILENKEEFSFVEQFSNCPSLANSCSGKRGICKIYHLIREMKQKQILKNYQEDNLVAILFQPVKAIAVDHRRNEIQKEELLTEMIMVIQKAILN